VTQVLVKRIARFLPFITLTLLVAVPHSITLPQEKPRTWEVYFSPHGGCTDAIIRELNKAQKGVLIQAYSFTSASIAKALLNAHKRGVKVEVKRVVCNKQAPT
jgi:phosphatidylserine/phosphatidylglycerophosphate/cardiolipin synthase-like enzyme